MARENKDVCEVYAMVVFSLFFFSIAYHLAYYTGMKTEVIVLVP